MRYLNVTAVLLGLALGTTLASAQERVMIVQGSGAVIGPATTGPGVPAEAANTVPADEIKPTLITLHLQNTLPEDLFAALGKQAGIRFSVQPDNLWDQAELQNEMNLDLNAVPFWDALRQVCDKTGLFPQQNYWGPDRSAKRLMLTRNDNGWGKFPMSASGPFLLMAQGLNINRYVNYANPGNSNEQCNLQLMVMAEPRLQVSAYLSSVDLTEAVDDAGNSLLMADRGGRVGTRATSFRSGTFRTSSMQDTQRTWQWQVSAQLKLPQTGAKRIASLKGTTQASVVQKTETFEVADLLTAKETSKTIGSNTITFKGAKALDNNANGNSPNSPATYEIEMQVASTDASGNRNPWAMLQSVQVLDADGKALQSNGVNGGNNNTYKLTFGRWANGPGKAPKEPAKLLLEVPTESKTVTIPIEFKDLPLP